MTVPGDAPKSGGRRSEQADLVPESAVVEEVPAAAVVAVDGTAAVPNTSSARARALVWLHRLERIRPRSAPVWAAAVIVLALVVGLISDYVALFDMMVLGSAGALAILTALGWGLLVGVSNGSARLTAMFATVPTFAVVVLVLRLTVATTKASVKQQIPLGLLVQTLAYALGFVFILLAFILGLVTDPRAFKRPALLALAGGVVVGTCWLPMMYRAASMSKLRSSPMAAPIGAPGRQPREMPVSPARPPLAESQARRMTPRKPTADDSGPKPPPRVVAVPSSSPASTAPTLPTPAPTAPVAPAVAAKAGAQVEVKWGGSWFAARVIRRENGWTWVEYKSDGSREWVEPWRMRQPGSTVNTVGFAKPNATSGNREAAAPSEPPSPAPTAH
jgi:hypothetical protein